MQRLNSGPEICCTSYRLNFFFFFKEIKQQIFFFFLKYYKYGIYKDPEKNILCNTNTSSSVKTRSIWVKGAKKERWEGKYGFVGSQTQRGTSLTLKGSLLETKAQQDLVDWNKIVEGYNLEQNMDFEAKDYKLF